MVEGEDMRQGQGVAATPPGHQPTASAVPASQSGVPNAKPWIEFRPDSKGHFDELVGRFGDGSVFVEMLADNALYFDLQWDDGKHCQVWISSKKKLRISHEYGEYDPPRYSAQGIDRKPWLPDYSAQGIEAGTGETQSGSTEGESPVGFADAPNSTPLHPGS